MTNKIISLTFGMLITLTLPRAQAAIKVTDTVSVFDLATVAQARKTLKQARASAADAADEAQQLRMIATPQFSPDAHLARLTALKGDVNRIGQEISRLETERESLAPWEQQTLDRVLPLLQETVVNTEGAIVYFNANRNRLWTGAYREYADHIWQDSELIVYNLKCVLNYDKMRDRERRAEERTWAESGE